MSPRKISHKFLNLKIRFSFSLEKMEEWLRIYNLRQTLTGVSSKCQCCRVSCCREVSYIIKNKQVRSRFEIKLPIKHCFKYKLVLIFFWSACLVGINDIWGKNPRYENMRFLYFLSLLSQFLLLFFHSLQFTFTFFSMFLKNTVRKYKILYIIWILLWLLLSMRYNKDNFFFLIKWNF